MSDLITIVIPVFNGEKYIEKCLDSILKQTYPSLEILIVNDGSTDDTGRIVKEYEVRYSNVRLITKENQGAAQARKTGIENAKGKYIGFVDADDWIDEEMYEILYSLCIENNAEISACGIIFEFGTKGIPAYKNQDFKCIYNNTEALEQINQRKDIRVYTCNKLYLRDVFNGVEFLTGNYIGEDYDMITKILSKTLNVAWTSKCLYHYLQATGTVSHRGFSESHVLAYNNYKKKCKSLSEQFPQYRTLFENYVLTEYIMFVVAMSRNGNYDKEILNEIVEFVNRNKSQYCKAGYIESKFRISVRIFCIHYKLFVLGYRTMEQMRYMLLK